MNYVGTMTKNKKAPSLNSEKRLFKIMNYILLIK